MIKRPIEEIKKTVRLTTLKWLMVETKNLANRKTSRQTIMTWVTVETKTIGM